MTSTTLIDRDPLFLVPPHEERDAEKLARLVASMEMDGWTGRPLLAWRCGRDGTLFALTGSHRIRAAVLAQLETVPVLVLEAEDEDLVRALEALRDFADLSGVLGEFEVEQDALDLARAEEDESSLNV